MALIRLDELLVQRGLCATRKEAEAFVLAGRVYSDGKRLEKPGTQVKEGISLEIESVECPYVSRGGLKLVHALETFGVPVSGRVCLDIGCSTGGFTDCLLQKGARHVFAVDVGYGLIDSKLRSDSRVTLLERTNARNLKRADFGKDSLELGVVDVSFISLTAVVPELHRAVGVAEWVCLFKPQFEVEPKFVQKGGIVSDEGAIQATLEMTKKAFEVSGLSEVSRPIRSPIAGKRSGNIEYFIHYRPLPS